MDGFPHPPRLLKLRALGMPILLTSLLTFENLVTQEQPRLVDIHDIIRPFNSRENMIERDLVSWFTRIEIYFRRYFRMILLVDQWPMFGRGYSRSGNLLKDVSKARKVCPRSDVCLM